MSSNKNLTLPCPGCNTILQFDAEDLLAGEKIKCTHCGVHIGLDPNAINSLNDPYTQFNKLNEIINDKKKNLNSDH